MKNLFSFTVVFLAVSMLACQDTKDEPISVLHDVAYYKTIGTQIPVETGLRWMDIYDQKSDLSGRRNPKYVVSANQLKTSLQSVENLTGVAFHHALDDNGAHHFIIIPVDESLSIWKSIPGRVYIDANTNTEISRSDARKWAKNYEEANADGIWFHFFGSNIFDDISTIPYFTKMNIRPAIKDLDLSAQLLLIIHKGNLGLSSGRLSSDDTVIYDASSPCPPCPQFNDND